MGVKRAIQKVPHSSLLQNAAAQHSVSGLHALLEGHAASPAGYKQSLRKLEDVMKIHTPYGCLVKYIEVPLTNGKAYTWAVCNPFALLYHLCEISSGWNRFLHKWLGGGAGLLLYTDECTPGNALHFQNLRDFTAIYFTMSKLPSWFRARARGWFKLGFIKTDMVKDVKGELAGVCRVVLHLLYNKGGFNFSIGMLLPAVRKTEARWRLQLTFLCFLQDAKAHKEVANVKGAAGLKSCLNCKNVGKFLDANKEPLQGHPYLHHYALALPDQFDQHTVESFWEIADKLAEQHGVVSKTEFKELEKCAVWAMSRTASFMTCMCDQSIALSRTLTGTRCTSWLQAVAFANMNATLSFTMPNMTSVCSQSRLMHGPPTYDGQVPSHQHLHFLCVGRPWPMQPRLHILYIYTRGKSCGGRWVAPC